MSQEELVGFFVEQARRDFSIVEENLDLVISDVRKSIESGLNYIEEFVLEDVLNQLNELRDSFNKKDSKFKGKLFGVPITVKDSICVKGIESKAGSKILRGYKPFFDATVIERIKKEGGIILAKTTQDEFGLGSFSIHTTKIPKNPFNKEYSCGGSSGGAGGFTSFTRAFHIALGVSTGGSIACPASFCGCVGFTPTYGLVSRFGLIDYANSLDKIGVIGKNVSDASLLLEVISGLDERDSTSLSNGFKGGVVPIKRIGVVTNFFDNCDEKVKQVIQKKISELKKLFVVEEVSLPLNEEYALSAYYIIASSEASTNLAKLAGLRVGVQGEVEGIHFDEYFSKIRSEEFGGEAKRRIILGTFARMSGFRDAYYLKALKSRTKLIEEFSKAFEKFDVLLYPTMPITPPKFVELNKSSPMQNYAMDLCTIPPNLAGLPHLSINAGFSDGLPVGLMIVAPHLEEKRLFSLGRVIEGE